MNSPAITHPSGEELKAFAVGKLNPATSEIILGHLETCEHCRRAVAESSGDSFLGRLRDARKPDGTAIPDKSVSGLSRSLNAPASAMGSPAGSLPPELATSAEYQSIEELGRGGMGVVYKAHNTLMGRDEVLKVMGKEIMSRPGAIDRFRREIQSAARLDHPNIVKAYSARLLGELLVFSMEYVPGDELAKLIRERGPLPVANACYYVQKVANGLQHAHEKGMVHRDIKPANLILHVDREKKKHSVKILDFGLAKLTSETVHDGGLTGEGRMLGTPDYIAPEQILDAQSADIRADIYSLGCTLYFLLAGHPPFQASSLYELLRQHREVNAQPLNFVCPQVPVELAGVIGKIMAKDPRRRYQTPAEVAKAMAPFVTKSGVIQANFPRELSQGTVPTEVPKSTVVPVRVEVVAPKSAPTTAVPAANAWETIGEGSTTEPEPVSLPITRTKLTTRSREKVRIARSRRPAWMWPAVAVGALVVLLLGLWSGGVFDVKVKAKDGQTIVVENCPADAEVLVDDETVTITRNGEQATVSLNREGPHKLKVVQGGKEVFSSDLTVKIGGEPVRVRVEKSPVVVPSITPTRSPTAEEKWKSEVLALRAEQQIVAVAEKMKERNPGFDGQINPKIENGKIIELSFPTDQVDDISPLGALPKLQRLYLKTVSGKGKLTDLTPLRGLSLTHLSVFGCSRLHDMTPLQGIELTWLEANHCHQLRDLTPLQGMPLSCLGLWQCQLVEELSPLRGMPLTVLDLNSCVRVRDLTPLRGMKLAWLNLNATQVGDLTPLRGMPLTSLSLWGCRQVKDLAPIQGLPLKSLDLSFCQVRDLTPLHDMPLKLLAICGCNQVRDLTCLQGLSLEYIHFTPKHVSKGIEIIRSMKNLRTIGLGGAESILPQEFWKRYDSGEFKLYQIENAIEGENLKILNKSGEFEVRPQDMTEFKGGKWSGDSQLVIATPKQGEWVDLELPIVADGRYHVLVYLTKSPDYGIVQFDLDGKPLGKPIDCFPADSTPRSGWKVVSTGAIDLGTVELKKGASTLRLKVIGTNENSWASRYHAGLDCIVLRHE